MTKVKIFVYGRRQQRRRRRGYDNSSPDFRHGELKIMVPCERYCHKEYTYEIWKLYLQWFESYGQG